MNNVIAIIPARSGSKSVVDKNIKELSGYPLIAYSIAVAQLSKIIKRVIVSTDSERYAKIALDYGAEVPFIRPAEYSKDDSTDRDFLIHAISWLEKKENYVPEFWVHLRPTTPLRDPLLVDEAIERIQRNERATSLRSGHKSPESPLKWFYKDSAGYFKGVAGNSDDEVYNMPKESFEDVFVPNGYVDIVRKSHVINSNNLHGERMIGYESPVITEVDSIEEFGLIQWQLNNYQSILLEHLKRGR